MPKLKEKHLEHIFLYGEGNTYRLTGSHETEFKMVSYWRQAGLSYLNFSTICARLVRRCLKPDFRVEALKREESIMKTVKWEGGKQAGEPKSIAQ